MPRTPYFIRIPARILPALAAVLIAPHVTAQSLPNVHPLPRAAYMALTEAEIAANAAELEKIAHGFVSSTFKPVERGTYNPPPAIASTSAPTDLYSHGDPTAEEQYILELINRARSNPAAEGQMLASIKDPDILFAYQNFSVDTNKLRTDFAGYAAKPPLAFNSKLIAAARLHSKDMSDNNFQDHVGSNGSTFDARINAQGYVGWSAIGENVFAYAQSLLYGHVSFNVDWGNPSLGHRDNIMNFKTSLFSEIGIGIEHNDQPFPHVGPIIITEVFGNVRKPFLVGVVYDDKNKNNFYDVGEGIPNVTVMPSTGKYYAVTSTSGGYAIPVGGTGTITITASGGTLGGEISKPVTLGQDNIKLDFIKGAASLPGIVSLVRPLNGPLGVPPTRSILLNWNAVASATKYQIQISTDSTFASGMLKDEELNDTAITTNGYEDGGVYYWRVRASNAQGWGSYSERRTFRVLLPLKSVTLLEPANGGSIPTDAQFRWKRGSVTESSYGIEVASDNAFTSIVAQDTAVTDTLKMVSTLPNGQQLYWRVRAKNEIGWGPYSETWSATTAVSSVDAGAAGRTFNLAGIMPNPVAGSARIEFNLAAAQAVELLVTDHLGNAVAVPARGVFEAGSHTVGWNAAGLPNGAYYCTLRAAGRSQTIRFVLMR